MKFIRRALYFLLFILVVGLFFVKAVPQAVPSEVFTENGAIYEIKYQKFSINEIIQNPDRHFSWFPHTNETKNYNLKTLIIAIICIVLFGLLFLILIKKNFN
jgi:hypothetical protein